ncbi:28194_t:CDS:2, partial [Gigaspora margarita]
RETNGSVNVIAIFLRNFTIELPYVSLPGTPSESSVAGTKQSFSHDVEDHIMNKFSGDYYYQCYIWFADSISACGVYGTWYSTPLCFECTSDSKMFNFGQSHPDIIQYVRSALASNANSTIVTTPTSFNTLGIGNDELASSQSTYTNMNNELLSTIKPSSDTSNKCCSKQFGHQGGRNEGTSQGITFPLKVNCLLSTYYMKLLQILHETFANIKPLLNSEKTVQSPSERSLLKNLGSWLGGMTLTRNKPIKHKNIALKDLLIEGYDNKYNGDRKKIDGWETCESSGVFLAQGFHRPGIVTFDKFLKTNNEQANVIKGRVAVIR